MSTAKERQRQAIAFVLEDDNDDDVSITTEKSTKPPVIDDEKTNTTGAEVVEGEEHHSTSTQNKSGSGGRGRRNDRTTGEKNNQHMNNNEEDSNDWMELQKHNRLQVLDYVEGIERDRVEGETGRIQQHDDVEQPLVVVVGVEQQPVESSQLQQKSITSFNTSPDPRSDDAVTAATIINDPGVGSPPSTTTTTRPGAFRVGGTASSSGGGNNTNGSGAGGGRSIDLADDDDDDNFNNNHPQPQQQEEQQDPPVPLDAEAVDEQAFENAIQDRLKQRTISAKDVRIESINTTSTTNQKKESSKPTTTTNKKKTNCIVFLSVVGLVCLGVSVIIVLVTTTPVKEDTTVVGNTSSDELTQTTMQSNNNNNKESLRDFIFPLSGVNLDDSSTPQYQALEWMLAATAMDNIDQKIEQEESSYSIVERYVLATLYFALGGEDWSIDTTNTFLSHNFSSSVCEWESVIIECGESGFVTGLNFRELFLCVCVTCQTTKEVFWGKQKTFLSPRYL